MNSKIIELEIKLSHCEDSIEMLNRTAFRQQQQIDLLQAQIRELYQLTQTNDSENQGSLRDEIPPHY